MNSTTATKGKSLKIASKVILESESGIANIISKIQDEIESDVKNMLGILNVRDMTRSTCLTLYNA